MRWLVFAPVGAPLQIKANRPRPQMTLGRAAVLGLIDRYLVPGFDYEVSLLEIQKLVYFLTEAGEHLNQVEFVRHHYGPYADVLRHVLERMDGHFIEGYGDGQNKPETPIHLQPQAVEEARAYLAQHPHTLARFERVAALIEGFETPFGMELLSTVHWVVSREGADSPQAALAAIHNWNARKARLMTLAHVQAAWERLHDKGWLAA